MNIKDYLRENAVDGIQWKAQYLFAEAESPAERQKALDKIAENIAKLPGELERSDHIQHLGSTLNIKKTTIANAVKRRLRKVNTASTGGIQLPDDIDSKDFLKHGFYERIDGHETGYYFASGSDKLTKVGNFIINPLFHKYSQDDNCRLVEINNGFQKKILELPSKSFVSNEQFAAFLFDQGNYVWNGSRQHLMKILNKIGGNFPLCFELRTLGWQPEGFFAFSDSIFNGKITPMDDRGIVEHQEKRYFSPAASSIYKQYRSEDDQFENDRFLKYQPTKTSFEEWAKLMEAAYSDKAMTAVAFVLISLFRDLVYKLDNNCPLLYAYGPTQSGKSKFLESILAVFFDGLNPFNLNQGTDFAFYRMVSRFRNCPVFLNELDTRTIRPHWWQAIKAFFDGEGRVRGRGGTKNRTETISINSTIMLAGQYLATEDDNACVNRSILVAFEGSPEEGRSQAEIKAYTKLKDLEKEGLSGILCELLKYRKEIEENYVETFNTIFKEIHYGVAAQNEKPEDRIIRNYTAAATMVKLFSQWFNLPMSAVQFQEHCQEEVIRLIRIKSDGSKLSDFWNSVSYLVDRGLIEYGYDYKVETKGHVKIAINRKETKVEEFQRPQKLLYLRLSNIQNAYEALKRDKSMNLSTLKHYLEPLKAFIGSCPNVKFRSGRTGRSTSTSAYVFHYDQLDVDLERKESDETPKHITQDAKVYDQPELINSHQGKQWKFRVYYPDAIAPEDVVIAHVYADQHLLNTKLQVDQEITLSGSITEKGEGDERRVTIIATEIILGGSGSDPPF